MAGELFTKGDLESFLQRSTPPSDDPDTPVDASAAIPQATYLVVEQVVRGEMLDAAQMTGFPDPRPAQVFSWALQLAAIAIDNPSALAAGATDRVTFSANETRRQAILRRVAEWGAGQAASPTTPAPQGQFPPPPGLPADLCHDRFTRAPFTVGWP